MLPAPALHSTSTRRGALFQHDKRRSHSFSSTVDYRATIRTFRGRSRLTNLGVLLLGSFSCLSFLYNLAFIFSSPSYTIHDTHFGDVPPASILATIERDEALTNLSHLIIVPGHAIWSGVTSEQAFDEDFWTLEDYQKGGGRISAFVDHIKQGVALALEDESSLLVFSGGQTRLLSTTTEGESYMRLALSMNLFQNHASASSGSLSPFPRATTETFSLDSFQNLLFSLARFHEVTGKYPSQITVVGYEMKRRRFEELHREALRFPAPHFHYIGLEPPLATKVELQTAREGELMNGYKPYIADVYGCHNFLLSKRRARNPSLRFHPYHASAPELRGLLEWCPDDPTEIYQGRLPWDE
ncbi:hypothetical protein F5I97DRAFT_1803768 [Phlebopus sp. FC_14]|nr:hypothetical protein F5I97DRAFT_1803768 [Phlebopus sp. FC_14]